MPVSIRCPMCQSQFNAGDHQRGQRVLCSSCRKPVLVPGSPAPKPAASAPAGKFGINCPSCKANCTVSEANRGKQVACPTCKKMMTVPGKASPIAAGRPAGSTAASPIAAGAGIVAVGGGAAKPKMNLGATLMKKKVGAFPLPLVLGAVAAVMLLFFVVGIVGAVILSRSGSSTDTQTANASSNSDGNAQTTKKTDDKKDDGKKKGDNKKEQPDPPKKVTPPPKNRPPLPANMSGDTLRKVKTATVFMSVTTWNGDKGEGSGFFGVQKGLVLTNAHVLGMLKQERKPRSIRIVYKSGEKDSKTYTGDILGVDRDSDLAVLRVRGNNLPEPLKVAPSSELRELLPVIIFGFPFGSKVGKDITASKTTISSLRKDDTGTYLEKVQVNGGMAPGNSGGPVVNTLGEIVGVAVAGYLGTNINFAVPGDRINNILDGRIQSVSRRSRGVSGSKYRMDIKISVINPLKGIREVGVTYWTGPKGKPRLPTTKLPVAKAGDGTHRTIKLSLSGDLANGSIEFDKATGSNTYWTQPYYVNRQGKKQWVAASPNRIGGGSTPGGTVVVNRRSFLRPDGLRDKSGRYIRIDSMFMQAGRQYTIDLMSTEFDPVLILFDDSGQLIDENDDRTPSTRDSRIVFTPRRTGLYRIVTTTFNRDRFGAFTLRVYKR